MAKNPMLNVLLWGVLYALAVVALQALGVHVPMGLAIAIGLAIGPIAADVSLARKGRTS